MVKPPDVFPKYRIQEVWKGSQAGAPKWWSCQWRVCSGRGLLYLGSKGKRVHLYGGAAAMRNGVKPLQWEGKRLVQEIFVALSFSFAFAFALACSFSKTFGDPFSEPFLGAFGGEFSFAFVFARDVEWRAIGKLTFIFTLVSTWWGSNGVCKRREVVIVLPGGILREGLLSGSAAAFGD